MKNILFLLLFLSTVFASAQSANDCIDAITVCGNTNILSNVSGFGIQELDRQSNACSFQEINSIWLSVTIDQGGSLAFNIRPDDVDLSVDYDFYVFGPNNGCGNFDSPIRCNTTNPLQAGLTYNLTGLRDSENETTGGPGSDGNGFVSSLEVTASEQYYILVDRPIGDGGFNIEWTGTAGFLESPIVDQPNPLIMCLNDSNTSIDLTQQEPAITLSTTAAITYYSSYKNAFDQSNIITNPTQFEYSNNTNEIYVRVTNSNGCFAIVDFEISPITFPSDPNLVYTLCDSDRNGTEEFSLSQIKDDIENSIGNISDFIVSLHPTEASANANTDSFTNNTITSDSDEIYARINSTALAAACVITYAVSLEVIADNYPATVSLSQCDLDEIDPTDGITSTNISRLFEETTGITGVDIFYYLSVEDSAIDTPISNPEQYSNTTPLNETLYYKIISNSCESLGEITLEIQPTTISTDPILSIITCDDNPDDQVQENTFDLKEIQQNNFSGQEILFYSSLDDVAVHQNPLEETFRTASTVIYAVDKNGIACENIDRIELIVQPLPAPILENSYQICTDGQPLLIEAPIGFDTYRWYKTNEDESEELSLTAEVSITEGGSYRLEAETIYQSNNATRTCIGATDFVVIEIIPAIIEEVNIRAANVGSIVEVLLANEGDFEYSIDGFEYQDSNQFTGIELGFYTVYARDKTGCEISQKEISVFGFPKFFTPNSDGINDFWQIIGASADLESQGIYIYDRYGKLVKKISIDDIGWDGAINGKNLPPSDYWFRFTLKNGEEFKGHFTLKR